MKPSTRYLTITECQDATGKGIAPAILGEFHKRGVQPGKIMSLGSDGASVMTGKINGKACSSFDGPFLSFLNINIYLIYLKLLEGT